MRFPLPSIALAAALLLAESSPVLALPVTFQWPADTLGAYKVHGFTDQPIAESRTFEIPENQMTRVTGPGFDFSFLVEKGAVKFPRPLLKDKMGVRFDGKANAFSFVTAEVVLDVKDLDIPVEWQGAPKKEPAESPASGGSQEYKVVYGHHTLRYPGTLVPFFVDPQGKVTLGKKIAGLTAQGSTLSIRGLPLTITAQAPDWQIARSSKKPAGASDVIRLLPQEGSYTFQSGGASRTSAPFFLGASGGLALTKEGPFQEFIILTDKTGAETARVAIPDGEALYAARTSRENREQETRDRAFTSSAAARWRKDISLDDVLQFYDFEEQQISENLDLPPGLDPAELTLLEFTDHTVRAIPFQISKNGNQTTAHFRAALPRGGSRLYRFAQGFEAQDISSQTPESPRLEKTSDPHVAELRNGKISVAVPAGRQEFADGKPLAQAAAPILSVTRRDTPALTGSFSAPEVLRVQSIDAEVLAAGPLFLVYEITYTLQGGKVYAVQLEIRAGEPEIAIAETLTGFTPDDRAFLRLDYGKGANPDHRLVASNGGYDYYSGPYNKGLNRDGKLDYVLSLYAPNSIGIARATAFTSETGPDALLFAINRPREWVTSKRATWGSGSLPENLEFYMRGPAKYLSAALAGSKRFWILGVIPRQDAVLTVPEGLNAPASGPEVRLLNRISDWNLNAYKVRLADWDEKLEAAPFNAPDFTADGGFSPMSYDEYVKEYFEGRNFFRWVRNASWDFSSENSPVSFRDMPQIFGKYAVSRSAWTPEQRARVRQALLFIADSSEGDANLPHHSMLAGHPNFAMDVKVVLPLAAATFPTHPRAQIWRDSFMKYYDEWLDKYSRKDVPDLGTKGGRWMENIACYVGQCFVGLLDSQHALKAYDGTSLGKNPQALAVIRWMRNAFMSPHDGARMIPPQGAHARAFEPGSKFWKAFFQFCSLIAEDDPQLAQEMRWIETNGKEGVKPDVQSAVFTDYGPVLHHDFGGPRESYAHMQVLAGPGYRWSNAGILYYGAKNTAWSYNNEETNGDEFNWNAVTAFTVDGKGLARRPSDQLLYDFEFVQFYRQPGEPTDAYQARAIMLVRDGYLVVSDEVQSPQTPGKFTWASAFGQPEIYQLKPAASAVESESHDKLPRRKEAPPDRPARIRSYQGTGDFLTVIAPEAVSAQSTRYGALVQGENVFVAPAETSITEGGLTFAGRYGYARTGQLALFQGTAIGRDGFLLRREGGDFGVSASMGKNRVTGRVVGRSGGKISVTIPNGPSQGQARVVFDGEEIPHTIENGAVGFSFAIAQSNGWKPYEITWGNPPAQ